VNFIQLHMARYNQCKGISFGGVFWVFLFIMFTVYVLVIYLSIRLFVASVENEALYYDLKYPGM